MEDVRFRTPLYDVVVFELAFDSRKTGIIPKSAQATSTHTA